MKPWKPTSSGVQLPASIRAGAHGADSAEYLVKMPPTERLLRERFATEYIQDFNPTEAARRVGFDGDYAVEAGRKLMTEVVTARLIQERLSAYDPSVHLSLGRVVGLLVKEGTREGPGASHAARVAALTNAAKIVGVGEANKNQTEVILGGVMVVPAAPATIEQWEAQAAHSQAKLKADVTK